MEKTASYQTRNTYTTLNSITPKTKYIWLVFHGLGYLSRHFIKHFQQLDPDEHYIICPQAPSKYYADKTYNKVGACWLTKENTTTETENILNYIDRIVEIEKPNNNLEFIVLGYSQGVSIASRWLTWRKQYCDRFIIISGKFPAEIKKEQTNHLSDAKIYVTIGENDPLIPTELALTEITRLNKIFPNLIETHHKGGHKLNTSLFDNYTR